MAGIVFRSHLVDSFAICALLLWLCPGIQGQSTVPRFTMALYTASVMENASVGTSVLSVTAQPATNPPPLCSSFSSITYSTIPAVLTLFSIQSNGTIVIKEQLDFETQQFHVFQVAAYDGCNQATAEVNITVLNVNDSAPLCSSHVVYLSISENTLPSNITLGLQCIDPDNISTISYAIVMGNDNNAFHISNGYLSTLKQLNYESVTQHLLFVHVTKATYPSAVTEVMIVVMVVATNEFSPVFTADIELSYNISESLTVGSKITNITAQDDDDGCDGIVTYSLSTAQDCFTIDPVGGNLALLCVLDREIQDHYYITIVAKDNPVDHSFQHSSNITIKVNVLDVNDNVPHFLQSLYTSSVLETAVTDTVLLTVHCNDADEGRNAVVTYYIVDGNDLNHFSVDPISGNLSISNNLNYESQQFYHLKVQCIDDGEQQLSSVVIVVVQVLSVNEYDPVIQLNHNGLYYIAEDTPVGSIITTVSATDMDSGPAGEILYSINRSNVVHCPEQLFQIDMTSGSLYLLSTLDKELELSFIPPTDYTYECSLVVSNEQLDRQATSVLRLSIININDIAPVCDQRLIIVEIYEDFIVGNNVCSFVCQDDDSATITYSIADPSSPFIVTHNTTHVVIQLLTQLDYETKTRYSFEVIVSDLGTPSLSTTVMVYVNVKNVNEHAPMFLVASDLVSVPEDTRVGTLLYTFSASDDDTDTNGSLYYTIVEGNNNFVALNEVTGALYLVASLDHERVNQFFLTVQVSDDDPINPLIDTAYLSVTIYDVNDNAPVFSSAAYFINLDETTMTGSSFSIPVCTDEDDGVNSLISCEIFMACSFAYGGSSCISITNNSFPFSFNFIVGEAIVTSMLDYEVAIQYVFDIICMDHGTPELSAIAAVYVEVIPVNEFTPSFDFPSYDITISEDLVIGSSFLRVTASDMDAGLDGELLYSLSSSGLHHFTIDPKTGSLFVAQPLDREQEMSYILEIMASDNSPDVNHSAQVNVYITVDDVNDNYPHCEQEIVIIRISELTPVNSTIIQLNCTDPDQLDTLHYSILSGNEQGLFSAHDDGSISLSSVLDRQEYHLLVSVADSSTTPLSVNCFVYVDRANQPPVFNSVQPFNISVPLSTSPGSLLLTVNATDRDGDVVYYSLLPSMSFLEIDLWSGNIYLIYNLLRSEAGHHTFLIRATDKKLSSTINLTVDVIDDLSYSLMFTRYLYFVSVPEDTRMNTTLLAVHCTSNYGDDVDSLQYYFTDPNPLFHVVQSTGQLTVSGVLDYELEDNHNMSIVCVDPTARSTAAIVIVNILPVNEHTPLLVVNTMEVNITENVTVGQRILQVNATDEDRDSQLRYYLNENFGLFHLDTFSGVLYLIHSLDYESQVSYNLSLTVTDEAPAVHSSFGNIIVHVIDSNDHNPFCDPSFISKVISDDVMVGQSVAMLNCKDQDSGINSQLDYTVAYSNSDLFAVNQTTGEIFVVQEPNTSTSFFLTIILVSDKGTPTLTFTVTVEINVLHLSNNVSSEVITAHDEGKNNSLVVIFAQLTLELWLTGAKQKFLSATAKAVTYFCAINSMSCSLESFCVRNLNELINSSRNFIVQFTSEDVIVHSEQALDDSLTIQFYVSLPEGAYKSDSAPTTHVLPLATLEEVFTENGDIIKGYTLSSSLAVATLVDSSKWKHLFLGEGAVVILIFILCLLGLAIYKYKHKKSMKVVPLLRRSETVSTFKLSSPREEYLISDADTDMASMENHAGRSSLGEMESSKSISSDDSQEEWPWASPRSLRPLSLPNRPTPVWTN